MSSFYRYQYLANYFILQDYSLDYMSGKQIAHSQLTPQQKAIQKEVQGLGLQTEVIQILDKQVVNVNAVAVCRKVIELISKYIQKLEQSSKGDHMVKAESSTTQAEPSRACKMEAKREDRGNDDNFQGIIYPSRKTKWVRNISKEEQKQKYEEQKYIAFSFCQHGINYHYITQKFPSMLPKVYRCIVQAVNNQTVNQIVDFLRYQCNVQVQRLNRDQKRSIRTQLTKIRQWLGNRDPEQLQTFYKFIYRHYDKSIEIKFQDALKIYKTIIQIIKSPFVNVLQAQEAAKEGTQKDGLTMEQQKAMVILFIKHNDENKVSDDLCQKYGYDMRWSLHSVRVKLKQFLAASIHKLISNFKQDVQEVYAKYFNVKRIELLQQSNDIELKIKLYSYYLQNKTTYVKVKDLLQKLREFFQIYGGDSSQASLPKLQNTYFSQFSLKQENTQQFDLQQSVIKKEEQEGTDDSSGKLSSDEVKLQ